MDKPLFIPLKTEFYEAFKSGKKSIEFRRFGKRWNRTTCYPSRRVTLSKGYGKNNRLTDVISSLTLVNIWDLDKPIRDSLEGIYGEGIKEVACIYLKDIKEPSQ